MVGQTANQYVLLCAIQDACCSDNILGRAAQLQCLGANVCDEEKLRFLFLLVRDDPGRKYAFH